MKRILYVLCIMAMLFACGCSVVHEDTMHTPVDTFFAGLNEGDFEKYKMSYLPETLESMDLFRFEAQYIDYRKSMQGERVIYEVLEEEALSGKLAEDVKRLYCDERGIEYEQLGCVRIRSNLKGMSQKAYCIKTNGKWSILSWFTLKE